MKRREVKSKAEKERHKHLNAEFQRIARRDKKAFLSDQCKEIQENSRMGKTRDLVKKIRDTKGIFHAKMGSIKDRNGMHLTEAEVIKNKFWSILQSSTLVQPMACLETRQVLNHSAAPLLLWLFEGLKEIIHVHVYSST